MPNFQKTMKTTIFAMFLLTLAAVSGCNAPSPASTWQTMTLIQAKPTLADIADTDNVREMGEGMSFEAKLSDESGKAVAQLLGMHTIVDTPGEDGVGNSTVEERFTTMAIVFDGGDEIMVHGSLVYPIDQKIMVVNEPQYRAVVGGTGRYKGIRGQVKTTRNADETYTHTLEYKID